MIGKIWKKSKLNSEKIHLFHIFSQFSSVVSKSFHYSTCLSSIFSKTFHYVLPYFPKHFTIFFHILPIFSLFSSLFSKSFHYSTYLFSIFSKSFHNSTYLSSIFSSYQKQALTVMISPLCTNCHDITVILLNVALNTINLTLYLQRHIPTYLSIYIFIRIIDFIQFLLVIFLSWWVSNFHNVFVNKGLGLWCLMPHSTILQLYHGSLYIKEIS
jgi:hypothetical protein